MYQRGGARPRTNRDAAVSLTYGHTHASERLLLSAPGPYAESLYSQHVKRGILFDGTFEAFFQIINPALYYNEHMLAWSDVVGENNCIVRLYEPAKADIVSDFMKNVLGIGDLAPFASMNRRANERVSRDVLEFKRLRNGTTRVTERDMERTILGLLDEEMGFRKAEPDYYQEFLSPNCARRTLATSRRRDAGSTRLAWLTAVSTVRSGRREGSLEALPGA